MTTKKPSLRDLAKRSIRPAVPGRVPRTRVQTKKVREALTSRLVANEYLRNGMDMKRAYETVTKKPYTPAKFQAMLSAPDCPFMGEIDTALKASEIEKNKVLAILWVQATSVLFDFMDDEGNMLTIAEIKKLPREIQALVKEAEVHTSYEHVMDEEGKPLKDKKGEFLMVPKQYVKLKMIDKQKALDSIAQIGKLIGPTVLNQNFVTNIGQIMLDADNRRVRAIEERGPRVIEHDRNES